MKFKCKLSGTVIELTHEVDIKTTLDNENYEPVEEKVVEEKPKAKQEKVDVKDKE